MTEIKNLQELLAPYIGPKKKVISSDVSRLTAPGENYMSVVLKIDVVVEDEETGKQETVHGVGKCIHHGNIIGWLKEFTKICFKKEMIFYTEILPTLQSFVEKNERFTKNFDIFPKLIAQRSNLHGETDEVDENSILLMENLAIKGFKNMDRTVGFDYEGAKRILKDLATFHVASIALKLKEPEIFDSKIRKHLIVEDFKPPEPADGEPKQEGPPDYSAMWLGALGDRSDCKPYIPNLEKLFEEIRQNKVVPWNDKVKTEPFATINHADMWVNNSLQILNGDEVLDNKLVDFQVFCYDSPAHDVLFFIWSSVRVPVIREHFDDLLEYYHKNFVETILEFGCDVAPFTYEKFQEELNISGDYQFVHTLMLSLAIFGKKGESAFEFTADAKPPEPKAEDISESLRERVAVLLKICCERGWL